MGVRNCEDLGRNCQKIIKRLLSNQNLLKLLYYEDKDPLSHKDLTPEQIKEDIEEKLIKVVPRVGPKETAKSLITLRVIHGEKNEENDNFRDVVFTIESFVPLSQWIIKDINLRPFAIMGEIERSLNKKSVDGLGVLMNDGFDLNFLTDEISCYEQVFQATAYK